MRDDFPRVLPMQDWITRPVREALPASSAAQLLRRPDEQTSVVAVAFQMRLPESRPLRLGISASRRRAAVRNSEERKKTGSDAASLPLNSQQSRLNPSPSQRSRPRWRSCASPCRHAGAPPSRHRGGSPRARRFRQLERRDDLSRARATLLRGRGEDRVAGVDLRRMDQRLAVEPRSRACAHSVAKPSGLAMSL